MKETDLLKPVIAWLQAQHWKVYQEVQIFCGGPVIDIVGVRDKLRWAIEGKTSFSLTVIEQAYRNQAFAQLSSVAVPSPRGSRGNGFASWICQNFGIGVLEVSPASKEYPVSQTVMPHIRRRVLHNYLSGALSDHRNVAEAGTNGGGYWTPYKATMHDVRRFLENHGPATIREIIEHVRTHYSERSEISSLQSSLRNFEADWCKIIPNPDGRGNIYQIRDRKESEVK